jgi:DNA-binding Lrp family transcriptional regulator
LESDGVISGYRAVVNPDAIGLSVLASIEITLSDHSTPAVEHVERALRDNPSVVEAHMVAGDSDYLIKVRVRDLADFERFVVRDLRAIDHIGAIHTHFAFGAVKEAAPLMPPPKRRKRITKT